MAQAFIIMQLGNGDLDRVCAEAIVPALKACGLIQSEWTSTTVVAF